MDKKIKIFLGAYVNFPNAQNINCEHIARYLDKDKFEVHTMYTNKMPIDKKKYQEQGIVLHPLIPHRYIWFWSKLFTMWRANADIYYMPKGESADICFMKRHRGKGKVFITSIEGVVGEQISVHDEDAKQQFAMSDGCFSISKCIQSSALEHWDMNTHVLYLGVNKPEQSIAQKERIQNVVWIGSVIERKRPCYLLECAKQFPQLQFYMIGDGDLLEEIKFEITQSKLENVHCLGRIDNSEVYQMLQKMDLLLMTSDKEGLPKVIGEAMSMRIPAIYIDECYDVDYIENESNGYAVKNLEEMIEKIQYLLDNPTKYCAMSEAAYTTIQAYTWENLIKDYEAYFAGHCRGRKRRDNI